MANITDPQKIRSIIDGKSAEIKAIDNDMIMETVGGSMSLDKLRESIERIETHLDDREFEKALQLGYRELAHNKLINRHLPRVFRDGFPCGLASD
ncbi:MAG: hypothetical protein HOP23_17065 [Methylococcaceae bacterium]|nr:hypothetical protein [Methylococcaceae bacterium]